MAMRRRVSLCQLMLTLGLRATDVGAQREADTLEAVVIKRAFHFDDVFLLQLVQVITELADHAAIL